MQKPLIRYWWLAPQKCMQTNVIEILSFEQYVSVIRFVCAICGLKLHGGSVDVIVDLSLICKYFVN